MYMRAAILTAQHQPLLIDEIVIPQTLEYGQVLVKIHYSGICGSQLGEINGAKGPDKYLPHLLGHEGSGEVIAVGAGVKRVVAGDHVVLHWRKSNGIEAATPSYRWDNKILNAGPVTTFNDYAIVGENRITKIPPEVDLRIAALFGCAVTTAMGIINNDAKVKIGESVVIIGLGGVGLNLVQAATMVSAYPIIGIDLVDEKLSLAKQFGLTHAFNATNTVDLPTAIKQIVGEQGADVIIDTTGNTKVIEMAYDLTHASGKTILVGVPKKGDNISIYSLPLHFNKLLTGSHGGNALPDEDIPRYVKLLKQGKLQLDAFITDEFPLEAINDAITLMQTGKTAGRIMINMRHSA